MLSGCGYNHCVRERAENDMFKSLKNEYNANNVAPMYPDFVRKEGGRYIALADAKYKRFLQREDRLQMIAYSSIYDTRVVSIIYPPTDENCGDVNDADVNETTIDDVNNGAEKRRGWFNIRSVASEQDDKTTNKYLRIISIGEIRTRYSFEAFAAAMASKENQLQRMLLETRPGAAD